MNKKTVWVATAVLALAASAASANSLTFQNVTFGTTDLGGGELQLTIDNALNANGDWTGIKYLEAFSLNDVGTFTSASLTGFTFNPGGLSNGSSTGCDSSASPGFACFLSTGGPTALTNSMVFDVFFSGGTPDFSLPHLKVDFWATDSQTKSTGNLLSMDIPGSSPPTSVPEPATLGLFGLGLTAVGFARRRRSV